MKTFTWFLDLGVDHYVFSNLREQKHYKIENVLQVRITYCTVFSKIGFGFNFNIRLVVLLRLPNFDLYIPCFAFSYYSR